MNGPRTVSGRILLREAIGISGAKLHVKLEDVSRCDAPGVLIAELILAIASPLAAGTELPFALAVPEVDDKARYCVRVHVDVTGSGDITAGDRISTVAHPVLTQGNPDNVSIEVKEI